MHIGIFSGSFNPVHIGHLALANWLCEYGQLDEVWFLVSPLNPLKEQSGLMDENIRLEMIKRAIDGYPGFKASDFEFHLPRPSYTITTLQALHKQFPEDNFTLIMGADSWYGITRWKDYRTLIHEFSILIYPRKGYDISIPQASLNIKKVEAPLIEVSSSFIRKALQKKKDIRFFLPDPVREIVYQLFGMANVR